MINLNLDNILDPAIRESFEEVIREFGLNPFLNGDLKHFETVVKRANAEYKFKHNLGFKPQDILVSHITPIGVTVKVNHEKTNSNFITFNVSGPCKFRFFAGLISTTKPVDIAQSDSGGDDGGSGGSSETYLIDSTPIGTVLQFSGETLPENYIWAHNQELSRAAYAELFAVVGTSFGEGDGSTTFNAPDMRGLIARGVDESSGRDPDAATRTAIATGGNTGDNVGSYQADELKAHTHTVGFANNIGGADNIHKNSSSTNHFSKVTSSTGGSETRPKNIYYNYIVKYTKGSIPVDPAVSWGETVPSFVNLPSEGTNGELRQVYDEKKIYRWNSTTETWESFGDALQSLSDVNISSPSDGDMLVYNSTSGKWENRRAKRTRKNISSGTGTVCTFNNLIVGKSYFISGRYRYNKPTQQGSATLSFSGGGTLPNWLFQQGNTAAAFSFDSCFAFGFVASATSFSISVSVSLGSGGGGEAELREDFTEDGGF